MAEQQITTQDVDFLRYIANMVKAADLGTMRDFFHYFNKDSDVRRLKDRYERQANALADKLEEMRGPTCEFCDKPATRKHLDYDVCDDEAHMRAAIDNVADRRT